MNSIGKRLVQIRKDNDLTQTQLGNMIGLKQTAIGQYENGNRNITEQSMLLLEQNLNINLQWLRTGEGEMYNKIDINGEDDLAEIAFEILQGDKNPFIDTIIDIMTTYKQLDDKSQKALINFASKLRENMRR